MNKERYAHLRADAFTSADLAAVSVDLSSPTGKVLPMMRTPVETASAKLETHFRPKAVDASGNMP